MTLLLQLVDRVTDEILFDFNDSTGTNNPYSVQTFVRGDGLRIGNSERPERTYFSPSDRPGGILVQRRDGLETSSWLQPMEAASYDDLVRARGSLVEALQRDGVALKWRATETSSVEYWDIEDGHVGALLRGEGSVDIGVLSGSRDYSGVPIEIVHQPYARLSEITSDTNKLVNPLLLEDVDGNGRPDGWTWDSATALSGEQTEAITEAYKFVITDSLTTRLLSSATVAAASGDVWTASIYGKTDSVAQIGLQVEFLDAADVSLATHSLAVAALSEFTRISRTTPAAPATTAKARVRVSVANSASPGVGTYRVRQVQLEKGSEPTPFVTSSKVVPMDPAAATAARIFPVFIAGDAPASVNFELTGPAGAKIQSIVLAARSSKETGGKSLALYMSRIAMQAESATFANDGTRAAGAITAGTVVADPDASGGNAVQAPLQNKTWSRYLRFTIADADRLEGLRGTFEVRLRMRLAGKKDAELQMRWGDSLISPAPNTNVPIRHNTAIDNLGSFGYVELSMGHVALPTSGNLDGLSIEIWARERDNLVDQNLVFDHIVLVPTEQRTTLSLPYSSRTVESGTAVALGAGLGNGRWKVTWRYSVQQPSSDFKVDFTVGGRTRSVAIPTDITNQTVAVEFDSVTATNYNATATAVAGTGTLTVHDVIVELVDYLEADQFITSDPLVGVDEAKKFTSGGRLAGDVAVGGPTPFWLPPGLSLVYVEVQEPRIGGMYSELRSVLTRSPRLAYSYAPRVTP